MPGEVNLRPLHRGALARAARSSTCRASTSRRRGAMRFVPLRPGARAAPERVRHRRAGGERAGARRPRRLDVGPDAGGRLRPARQPARHGRRLLRSRAAPPRDAIAPLAPAAARRPRLRLPASRDASSRRAWDVPLDVVVTERGVIVPRPAARTAHRSTPVNYWLFKSEPAPSAWTTWRARAERDDRLGRRAQLPGPQHAARHDAQGRPGLPLPLELRRAGHLRHRAAWCARATRSAPRSIRSTATTTRRATREARAGTRRRAPRAADRPADHARNACANMRTERSRSMLILRRGNRLSVTPVTRDEWRFITSLE